MQQPDFAKWSSDEIHKAELAAADFLDENVGEIADTFEKRLTIIRRIVALLKTDITFNQRMNYLAMIEELSTGLGQSAREFFDIGCGPSVAGLLKQ